MDFIFSKKRVNQALVFLGATFFVSASVMAAISIDQQPLLATKPVPANVAILGSFEFPTMVTRAYLEGASAVTEDVNEDADIDNVEDEEKIDKKKSEENQNTYYDDQFYIGYFDSKKCYKYHYESDEKKRYFYPVKFAEQAPLCPNDREWSGNFLNWASMQTIDIFRHTLTGGHRSTDKPGETILEKGYQSGQGINKGITNISEDALFPIGKVSILTNRGSKDTIRNALPVKWNWVRTRIGQKGVAFGNELRFTESGTLKDALLNLLKKDFDPSKHYPGSIRFPRVNVYKVSVRVKVCVKGLLEDNCELQPDGNYKPVGLIQRYAESEGVPRMRFSAFGYLNDPSNANNNRNRKGGVMHARMKYVGPNRADNNNITESNPNAEWDARTGVFTLNPDPIDAAATPKGKNEVKHSGVINFINRSGHIVPNTQFKQYDNVSELYYTAYRYMKGLPNIAAYSNVSDKSGEALDRLVGGLPVIHQWNNNEQHLAAGSTLNDPIQFTCQKNFVLGIGDSSTHNDWGIVEDGIDDPLFKTVFSELRHNMHQREGISDTYTDKTKGSDYIAVLAYNANTADLRPDMVGKQTMQTYWVDILEYVSKRKSSLKPKANNPYWMATKYGGFKVPERFDPTKSRNSIPNELWTTTGDTLPTNDLRPDNFFPVNNPLEVINSLNRAFQNIQLDQRGGSSSLSLSTTSPDEEAMVYQANYVSGAWTGNLYGYTLDSSGKTINETPKWDAESQLPEWNERKVYINNGGLKDFKTHGVNIKGLSQSQVNYLLGDNSKVKENNFRKRTSILGDIVNSKPVYVGSPRVDAFSLRSFPGTDSYAQWARNNKRTPVVYVGGNDGMLHGFDAQSGKELFAYIPATVVANGLTELTKPSYNHRYFVDGEITVADVYINNAWRTVLVGTLGSGGVARNREATNNAVFALDITKPDAVTLLWEKDSSDIKDADGNPALGVSLGKPVIIQNAKNQWRVVLGNGPNSGVQTADKSSASLISIDLFDGASTVTPVASTLDNGLSAIRAWDSTGDGLTDTLYAGDLNGNIWKFDLSTATPTASKVFTATDAQGVPQPITTVPLVGISPYDRSTWIFVGTGLYLSVKDAVNAQVQSWYGIKDNTKKGKQRGDLLQRKIFKDVALSGTDTIKVARVIEGGTRTDLADKEGWYLDFYSMLGDKPVATGERMITPNRFQGGALTGTTRNPNANDPCAIDGAGMTMALDPFSGTPLPSNYFDVNEDGEITDTGEEDMVTIGGKKYIVSGVGFDTGFSDTTVLGNRIYAQTDSGELLDVVFKSYTSGLSRSSWRELINREN